MRNGHPFAYGPWLFAHNGTLRGFTEEPQHLHECIAAHFRPCIAGETDSEHAFFFVLTRLEQLAGSLDGGVDAASAGAALADVIPTLARLYPGEGASPSELNFVLTDGKVLVASRWRHSLFWLERRGLVSGEIDGPAEPSAAYRAVVVASEPTTVETWFEVRDSTLIEIDADLTYRLRPISS